MTQVLATAQKGLYLPTRIAQAYTEARLQVGRKPFPNPQEEWQMLRNRLWELRVTVAGTKEEMTDVGFLRDLVQKYEVTQPQEAVKLAARAAERARKAAPQEQQVEALRDLNAFAKRREKGIKAHYGGVTLEG